jgi:hypothetical protein
MAGGKGEKKEIKVGPIHPPAFTIELVDARNAPLSGESCTVSVDGKAEDKQTDDSGKIATLRPKENITITLK